MVSASILDYEVPLLLCFAVCNFLPWLRIPFSGKKLHRFFCAGTRTPHRDSGWT